MTTKEKILKELIEKYLELIAVEDFGAADIVKKEIEYWEKKPI